MTVEIHLEDKGQDLLTIITDENGQIIECKPFHTNIYKGGYIPLESQKIGQPCMIHHPPHNEFGFLKYKVTKIKRNKVKTCQKQTNSSKHEHKLI